ncbi:MAG TPA: hypothetical protein VMF91_12245 [Bryobacteraceae bacterium]|nr:hypothetical protein [Bryobacteraceae bacterium]
MHISLRMFDHAASRQRVTLCVLFCTPLCGLSITFVVQDILTVLLHGTQRYRDMEEFGESPPNT